jgi:lysophospholipase
LEFVGSKFDAGILAKNETCVRGFDNAGFVMGTSSSLFNQVVFFLSNGSTGIVPEKVPDFVLDGITSILTSIGESNNDIADFTPNAFYHWTPPSDGVNTAVYSDDKRLTLVDGGEDLQNIPYHPLLLNHRNVDVIVSIDSSADTKSGWPDGASIVATYQRSLEGIAEGTSFPTVPGKNSFLNLGLNDRPVFFGCNKTTKATPLVVYIPYHPYVYTANISTWSTTVNNTERDAIIANGYQVATMGNGTRDPEWPVCMACAILLRSFQREGNGERQVNGTGTAFGVGVPTGCASCLNRYCWDGTVNESPPPEYWPPLFGVKIDVRGAGLRNELPVIMALGLAILVGGLFAC